MVSRLLVIAIAVTLAVPAAAQTGGRAAVDEVLAGAVARGDVPGVVVIAADRSGVIYQGAFGVADPSRPQGRF